jgi:predicted alpha/beta hydrolase family esterase
MARVLIMHGWKNHRVPGNWHRHLATELRKLGHQVFYPQFPSADEPKLVEWQNLLVEELTHLGEAGDGEIVVVGNWIQAAATGILPFKVDRLLLAAPADPNLLLDLPGLRVNLEDPDVRDAVLDSAHSVTLVGSDEDPWTPNGLQKTYGAPLGLEAVLIEGARHLALSDGFSYWQGVIDWVLDPSADLRIR